MHSKLEIGEPGWVRRLEAWDGRQSESLLAALRPWSREEVAQVEESLKRVLPVDMKLFLVEFGSGEFGHSGWSIYHSDAFVAACTGPLEVLTDLPGHVPAETLREFYVSRGRTVTLPGVVTTKNDVDVFDLVQFGADGRCGYQVVQTAVGRAPSYYELYISTMTRLAGSFSDWLQHAIPGLRV